MWNACLRAGVLFACSLLVGCANLFPQTSVLRDAWPAGLPDTAEITEAPFFPQAEYQCGPAALATVLAHSGAPVTADSLVEQVYIPGRKGSIQAEMIAAARRNGTVPYVLAPRFENVLREVAAGTPVVVLQNYGASPDDIWHYAVVVGYDRGTGRLIMRSGETRRHTMMLPFFEYTWRAGSYWAMVATPPERIPATADPGRYLEAIVALESVGAARAAARAYGAYLARWPDTLAAQVGLANAHYALGELDAAETALRAAVRQHPDSVIAVNNLAHTLSVSGRAAEALELIDSIAQRDDPHAAALAKTRAGILERLNRQ